MSSRIREIISLKTAQDGSTKYVVAQIDCDTAADLPAVTHFTGITLLMGSRSHDIGQNADYEMQSDGTWVLSQPGQAAYTKAEVDALVAAAFTQAVTQASSQVIPLSYGLGTQIPNNSDMDDYTTAGIYYVGSNASAGTIANIPAPYGGRLEVKYSISTSYFFQEYITNSTPVGKYIRRKLSSGYTAWQAVTYT